MSENKEIVKRLSYKIKEKTNTLLGRGAFSSVYLGKADVDVFVNEVLKESKKDVSIALKEINNNLDKETLQTINNELAISSTLNDNSNIVKMIDIIYIKDKPYIAYEYCNGGDLRKYIEYFKNFDEGLIQTIMIQMVNGLIELFKKNVVHHDIKPENILLNLCYNIEKPEELLKKINEILDNKVDNKQENTNNNYVFINNNPIHLFNFQNNLNNNMLNMNNNMNMVNMNNNMMNLNNNNMMVDMNNNMLNMNNNNMMANMNNNMLNMNNNNTMLNMNNNNTMVNMNNNMMNMNNNNMMMNINNNMNMVNMNNNMMNLNNNNMVNMNNNMININNNMMNMNNNMMGAPHIQGECNQNNLLPNNNICNCFPNLNCNNYSLMTQNNLDLTNLNNNINPLVNNQRKDIFTKEQFLNILKESTEYKLSDFGLSKLKTDIKKRNLCGSPLYMSPELFKLDSKLSEIENKKVDIWALGVLAYELFFGKRPFEAFSIEALSKMFDKGTYIINLRNGNRKRKISKEFFHFINKCLQKDPEKRANVYELNNSDFFANDISSSEKMGEQELYRYLKGKVEFDFDGNFILSINKDYAEEIKN